jgi:hypothetical protein
MAEVRHGQSGMFIAPLPVDAWRDQERKRRRQQHHTAKSPEKIKIF